jgi:hypothetical protein
MRIVFVSADIVAGVTLQAMDKDEMTRTDTQAKIKHGFVFILLSFRAKN